jgi:ABC-type lipoprotein export system ATPase subunit
MHELDKTTVEARGLGKVYCDGSRKLEIFKCITISIASGQAVAVLGPSGCGKTTLINLLSGLDQPTSGQVWLDGVLLNAMTQAHKAQLRSRAVGFVFQSYHLMAEFTALENVMLPAMIADGRLAAKAVKAKATQLLERVGLTQRVRHYPSELSGGEQQRVAIARALVNDPKIVFCDEPTGNLDLETGERIIDLIQDLHQKQRKTVILVTHDQRIAQKADRIFNLVTGHWTK